MRHVTLSRETGAPAMHVVDFLTRPETLPLWAFHYCRSVASDGQGHIIETTQGDKLRYAPRAFPESGVVDLLSGADEKSMQALPLRVHALGPQRSRGGWARTGAVHQGPSRLSAPVPTRAAASVD